MLLSPLSLSNTAFITAVVERFGGVGVVVGVVGDILTVADIVAGWVVIEGISHTVFFWHLCIDVVVVVEIAFTGVVGTADIGTVELLVLELTKLWVL